MTFDSGLSISNLATQTNHLESFEDKLSDKITQRPIGSESLEVGPRQRYVSFSLSWGF